jgi:ABC-type Fe3+ transport system permease subunit
MTTSEAVVLVIVVIVCVIWDVLILRQILRGETAAFSAEKYERPRGRHRKTEPVAFWLSIGMQLIFPNGALLYILYWLSTLAD